MWDCGLTHCLFHLFFLIFHLHFSFLVLFFFHYFLYDHSSSFLFSFSFPIPSLVVSPLFEVNIMKQIIIIIIIKIMSLNQEHNIKSLAML